jgi:archaellum component FlaG (FlaF/FlaG flagellin family)
VLHTDIRVFIDDVEIRGYNIDGWTYIVAEDLRAYGFAVIWNPSTLSLEISKGASTEEPKSIPINTMPTGSVAFPYVSTDIVTFIDGSWIPSFNIGGNTVIQIDTISDAFGRLDWNPVAAEVRVTIDKSEPKVGDVLGNVLHTNIRVFIDDVEIRGYNIDGWTYIVAEDLRAYGFAVIWNPEILSLSISRGASTETPKPVPINEMPTGSIAFPYVHTDIVAFINGTMIPSFNIQGSTVIQVDYVADAFGQFVWDSDAAQVRVTTK